MCSLVLLHALGGVHQPRDLDLSPLFRLLEDDRWLVRHSAIQALRHTDSPAVEDHVLHRLGATSDPKDMTYCHATLNQIGSAQAIPQLEKNLKSRKADVKMSAKFAIEAIKARAES
jgi:HEAT repeat protein